MAVKTITIDIEAYDALASRKRPGESFSQVIKRTLREERYTAANLLNHLAQIQMPDDALDAAEEKIERRSDDLIAHPPAGDDD